MKLGTENKKSVYALIVLGVVAAFLVYTQLLSGPSYTPPVPRPAGSEDGTTAGVPTEKGPDISRASERVTKSKSAKSGEFRPKIRPKNPEERLDAAKQDPSLRLDLLTKVMSVPPAGGDRDLFQILKAPPVKTGAAVLAGVEPKIRERMGPNQPTPPAPPPPPPPPQPPTPIPLHYYGYSAIHPNGKRTAYFHPADNPEENLQADEGQILKNRYRIVQIGIDKVLVEDTIQKNRQALKIEPEITG
jgi:hypothetical protein